MFDDLLAANKSYSATHNEAKGGSAKHLAIVTCMDSRIDPLASLGLLTGDAKIIRNAGGRVTDDALRSLILSTSLLGVTRIAVIQHTDCAMTKSSEAELASTIADVTGESVDGYEFMAMADQPSAIRGDITLIRTCPLIPDSTEVQGFLYDVHSGELTPLESE